MKPRNKKERLLLELSKKLPPLTQRQRDYPKEHFHKKIGYYWKKGLVWCQCCGKEYHVMKSSLAVSLDLEEDVCEWCGNIIHLEHAGTTRNKYFDGKCYMVVTTIKGWQVLRCFDAARRNERGKDAVYSVDEKFQIWIGEDGKETILKKSYTRSPFSLTWCYGSEFSIAEHNGHCSGMYQMEDVFDVNGYYAYPRAYVMPALRRRGWRNGFLGINNVDVAELMTALLTSTEIETLAKTGQVDIMRYWIREGLYKRKNSDKGRLYAVNICNRNNYTIEDAGLWYDMMDALECLGLDTHSPHYICPKDLSKAHDTYVRRAERLKARQEAEQRRRELIANEAAFREMKGIFFGICFGNGDITVTVLSSLLQYAEEGRAMHHCVDANDYWKKKTSLILSARDKSNKRLATVELSLNTFKVLQCRAACNRRPERYDDIVKLIESHKEVFIKAKAAL